MRAFLVLYMTVVPAAPSGSARQAARGRWAVAVHRQVPGSAFIQAEWPLADEAAAEVQQKAEARLL